MNCPDREHLIEFAIAGMLGESREAEDRITQSHVAACPSCQRRLSNYKQLVGAIRQTLSETGAQKSPGDCLDPNLLAEYADGALDQTMARRVEEHAADCDDCLTQLAELAGLRQTMPMPSSFLGYVIRLTREGLQLLAHPESGFSPCAPEPMAVMGPENSAGNLAVKQEWIQEQGDLALRFSICQLDESRVNLDLTITRRTTPPRGTRFSIWRGGQLLQSEALAEDGHIALSGLAAEDYEAEIITPSGESFPFTVSLQKQ